jgi:hypothetical protein
MMLCLVNDIGRDRFHIGLADGEGTVSILPPKAIGRLFQGQSLLRLPRG